MKTKTRSLSGLQIGWHIPLAVLVAISLVPILFAALYSLKSLQDIYSDAGLLGTGFTLDNFREIARALPIGRITLNTLTVAVIVTACKLVTSVLAAYAFVFTSFRGKTALYFLLISTIFIPFTVTMIPNYITVSRLGLFDSVFGIVLPQLADATGIFLLRQTMRSIPKSLIEIAQLDGVSRMRTLWDIHRGHRHHLLHQLLERVRMAHPDPADGGELHPLPGHAAVLQCRGRHRLHRRHGHGRGVHADPRAAVPDLPALYHEHLCLLRHQGLTQKGQTLWLNNNPSSLTMWPRPIRRAARSSRT